MMVNYPSLLGKRKDDGQLCFIAGEEERIDDGQLCFIAGGEDR